MQTIPMNLIIKVNFINIIIIIISVIMIIKIELCFGSIKRMYIKLKQ